MKILVECAKNEIVVKGSRFIAEVFPVETQAQAREKLHEQKSLYSDATHVCHAFITGLGAETCGMSDDGEPGGTAGRPMLDVLKGSGITNILLTVTRYFGGTLLGTGGLVRAYGDSAKGVLAICKGEEYIKKDSFAFECGYEIYDSLKRALENFHIEGMSEDFGASVKVSGKIHSEEFATLGERLLDLSKGKISLEKIQPLI